MKAEIPGIEALFGGLAKSAPDVVLEREKIEVGEKSYGDNSLSARIVLYMTDEMMVALEEARLILTRKGKKTDRGKIVRVAIANLLNSDNWQENF